MNNRTTFHRPIRDEALGNGHSGSHHTRTVNDFLRIEGIGVAMSSFAEG
jgi:hypothetical protein